MRTISSTAKPAATEDKTAPAEEKAKKDDLEEGEIDEEADDEACAADDGEKSAKKKKATKATKTVKTKKSKGERKRGPARPYRKLQQEILESRIKKLEKRIERTSAQAEEGRTFLSKYTREQAFRDAEATKAAA